MPIEIEADLERSPPAFQNVEQEIRDGRISPTGVRAVFEAHGEILTVPAEKGDIRNLTHTPGVMERTPAWSPDGQSIAYFSDESGEYALHVKPQTGEAKPQEIPLAGNSASISHHTGRPTANTSPSTTINSIFGDVDIASGKVTKIDTDYFYSYDDLERDFAWSPDSKWIALCASSCRTACMPSRSIRSTTDRARRSPTA